MSKLFLFKFEFLIIDLIRNLFFRPPPQNKYLLDLSLFKNFIPSAIKYAVNSVIVEQPSSKDKPLAKDVSNSFTSSDFE